MISYNYLLKVKNSHADIKNVVFQGLRVGGFNQVPDQKCKKVK